MIKKLYLCCAFFLLLSGNLPALDDNFCEKINSLKWVAYSPTHFNPQSNLYPLPESIENDLKLLFSCGFNGIITYGSQSTLADIPKIAKGIGFKGVIMGVWDIKDRNEITNAIFMADYADGYCIGNEGLYVRYDLEELKASISYIKEKTGRPVTTTEEFSDYCKDYVVELGDWVFPNIHPFLSTVKNPPKAVNWIRQHYRIIKRKADKLDKPILLKEVGWPTRGESSATARNQKKFFELIEKTEVKFAYFEAFDQYWKCQLAVEPCWGLFNKDRKPKQFIKEKIDQNGSI